MPGAVHAVLVLLQDYEKDFKASRGYSFIMDKFQLAGSPWPAGLFHWVTWLCWRQESLHHAQILLVAFWFHPNSPAACSPFKRTLKEVDSGSPWNGTAEQATGDWQVAHVEKAAKAWSHFWDDQAIDAF